MANRKFNQEIATNIREDYFCKGMLQKDITQKYKMSRWAVAEIIKNRGWKINDEKQAYYEEQLRILKIVIPPTHKVCRTCKINKDISNFNKSKTNKDRFQWNCRSCLSIYKKEYAIKNADKLKIKRRSYYQLNKTIIVNRSKQWYQNNKKEKKIYDQGRYLKKGDELRQLGKERYHNNKKICIERGRQYANRKYLTDPIFKIKNRISCEIRRALQKSGSSKNGHSILEFLPYTMQELKIHIENQFAAWMTWKNWGKYDSKTWDDNDDSTKTWQLDHIIPQSDLPYASMKDDNFRECWKLSNLRPLNAKENLLDGVYRKRHKK